MLHKLSKMIKNGDLQEDGTKDDRKVLDVHFGDFCLLYDAIEQFEKHLEDFLVWKGKCCDETVEIIVSEVRISETSRSPPTIKQMCAQK